MKIEKGIDIEHILKTYVLITSQDTRVGGEHHQPLTGHGDKVTLSRSAKELQAVLACLNQVPDARMDRVKELEERVQSGDYQVDSLKIAESLLAEMREQAEMAKKR
ncbi:MAG: flagellar biosynthesis anti-sigma factor FlgM [Clostridia bacterium]|nr:flagellar biosynthesis anti-sigma factor FlgM [Clostridia bacterium]